MTEKKNLKLTGILLSSMVILSLAAGFGGGYLATVWQQTETTVTQTAVTAGVTQISQKDQAVRDLSISEIAAIAAPSVVEITTEVLVTGSRMQQVISEGAGSGVILSSDGLIATNNHVIADAQSITVRLATGESYSAVLIGTDEETDLAVIKIAAAGLSAAMWGDSEKLAVGDLAVAIGNPLGELGGTVTDGIISALDREIIIDHETMTLLQTNAAINPGNSGGGLFDGQGNLIGIVNAKSSGDDIEGLGFAIPINIAGPILEQLIQYGYVQGRIDLGMTLIDISTSAAAYAYRVSRTGVYILEVDRGSNAEQAGLASGDCITAVNGTAVESAAAVDAIIDSLEVGQSVTFTIYRNRASFDISMILIEKRDI